MIMMTSPPRAMLNVTSYQYRTATGMKEIIHRSVRAVFYNITWHHTGMRSLLDLLLQTRRFYTK